MNSSEILKVNKVNTHFFTSEGVVKAVNDVSFNIGKGESVGLVGESGCGKSITALSILRLIPNPPGKTVGGEIYFKGRDLLQLQENQMRHIRGNEISMIFQEPSSSMNPAFTIGNQMKEVIRFHQGGNSNQIREKVFQILGDVYIPDPERILSQYPHELSGGMLQRIMIAMAISCEPDLLICDEPTTALDVSTQAQIIELLAELRDKQNTSFLFITHDLGVLSWVCTSAAIMYAGNIVEYSDIRRIIGNPRHPYTQALIGSAPTLEADIQMLKVIPGQVPSLIQPPSGCKFHPRCDLAREDCKKSSPPFEEKEKGHWTACFFA